MVEVFKEKIVDFEQCTVAKAAEMDIRISDMIIRELLPDMVEEEQVWLFTERAENQWAVKHDQC